MSFIVENWAVLLLGVMAFVKIVVNLTPTESDNKIFAFIDKIIGWIVPNLKKGGGKF